MWRLFLSVLLCFRCLSVQIELERSLRLQASQTEAEGDGYDGPGEQGDDDDEDDEEEAERTSNHRRGHRRPPVHQPRASPIDRAQIEAKLSKLTEVLSQLQNPSSSSSAAANTPLTTISVPSSFATATAVSSPSSSSISSLAEPLMPRLAAQPVITPVHAQHFRPRRLRGPQTASSEKVAMSANFVETSPPPATVAMLKPVARVIEPFVVAPQKRHEDEDDRATDRSIRSALRVIDSSKHTALASRLQKELKHTSDNTEILLDVAKQFRTASRSLDQVTDDIDRLSEGIL